MANDFFDLDVQVHAATAQEANSLQILTQTCTLKLTACGECN
ncbi:FDLD family class I lanthipeptide [Tumebacillus avium]|nr:FDLD family class I lanthipeptide [Tumebacillus avium]